MKLPLITLAPLLVEADDFVDEIDAGETAPLRLAYFLRDSSLLFSEQINVQHSFIFSFFLSRIECEWKKERKKESKDILLELLAQSQLCHNPT